MKQNNTFYFVSDIHGSRTRYSTLFSLIEKSPPRCLLVGGDILPSGYFFSGNRHSYNAFFDDFFIPRLHALRDTLGNQYPEIMIIMGNDDQRNAEPFLYAGEKNGLFTYLSSRKFILEPYSLFGYSFVPPTPFLLKDWERYDVSQYADPLCIHPSEGLHTADISEYEKNHATIQEDISLLTADEDMDRAIFLFHTPPYMTNLDIADLAGKTVDHVPLDPHVGSIAVKRFIEDRQPLITLHGHIHESAILSGSWRDRIGRTRLYSASHHGAELAVVMFDPEHPEKADRILL